VLKLHISESTVRSIRDVYREELKNRRRAGVEEPLRILHERTRGRSLLLGDDLDKKLQLYGQKLREGSATVSTKVVMAAACGIIMAYDRQKLVADELEGEEAGNGVGYIRLNRHWAYAFLKRMNFVKRKASTAKSKYSVTDFAEIKRSFLRSVIQTVTMEEIPPELILNWDQTGIMIIPSSSWTMEERGATRVELTALKDKRQITCGSIQGDFLPIQLIYKGTTNRCHPRYKFPVDWHITHTKKHWSTEATMIQYIQRIIVPYVNANRESSDQAAVVILDNFKGQVTPAVTRLLEENNIHECLLPPNTTDKLQPMDLTVNKPAKDFLTEKFQEWYSNQIWQQLDPSLDIEEQQLQPVDLSLPALRELGAKWLVEMAEYISSNPSFIVKGFSRSGISRALDGTDSDEEETDPDYSESSEESSDEDTSEDESDSETLDIIELSSSDEQL